MASEAIPYSPLIHPIPPRDTERWLVVSRLHSPFLPHLATHRLLGSLASAVLGRGQGPGGRVAALLEEVHMVVFVLVRVPL